MKRLTELTLFTLTVAVLTLACLQGALNMRLSLDAMAENAAKTYLLNRQPQPIKIIQEGTDEFPEVEYVSDAELDAEIAK